MASGLQPVDAGLAAGIEAPSMSCAPLDQEACSSLTQPFLSIPHATLAAEVDMYHDLSRQDRSLIGEPSAMARYFFDAHMYGHGNFG